MLNKEPGGRAFVLPSAEGAHLAEPRSSPGWSPLCAPSHYAPYVTPVTLY